MQGGSHKSIQKKMIDLYYEDRELPDFILNHINNCETCAQFWNGLNKLGNRVDSLYNMQLNQFDGQSTAKDGGQDHIDKQPELEPDIRLIRAAVAKAEEINKERNDFKAFVAFLLLAISIILFAGWAALAGYGDIFIKIQLALMIVSPVLLPFMIIRRISREDKS